MKIMYMHLNKAPQHISCITLKLLKLAYKACTCTLHFTN